MKDDSQIIADLAYALARERQERANVEQRYAWAMKKIKQLEEIIEELETGY